MRPHALLTDVADLVLGRRCLLCEAIGTALCPTCLTAPARPGPNGRRRVGPAVGHGEPAVRERGQDTDPGVQGARQPRPDADARRPARRRPRAAPASTAGRTHGRGPGALAPTIRTRVRRAGRHLPAPRSARSQHGAGPCSSSRGSRLPSTYRPLKDLTRDERRRRIEGAFRVPARAHRHGSRAATGRRGPGRRRSHHRGDPRRGGAHPRRCGHPRRRRGGGDVG